MKKKKNTRLYLKTFLVILIYIKGCIKNLILGRSQFTTRKKILNIFLVGFNGYIYSRFLSKKSALNVVSVSIFDDLRYSFENAGCQPYIYELRIYIYKIFDHLQPMMDDYRCRRPENPVIICSTTEGGRG